MADRSTLSVDDFTTRRLAGLALLIGATLLFDFNAHVAVQVALLIMFVAGAYMVIGSAFAIAFTLACYGGVQIALGRDTTFIVAVTALTALVAVIIVAQRFYERVRETRAARWAERTRNED